MSCAHRPAVRVLPGAPHFYLGIDSARGRVARYVVLRQIPSYTIRSFADDTTKDIWNGVNSKAARRVPRGSLADCPAQAGSN